MTRSLTQSWLSQNEHWGSFLLRLRTRLSVVDTCIHVCNCSFFFSASTHWIGWHSGVSDTFCNSMFSLSPVELFGKEEQLSLLSKEMCDGLRGPVGSYDWPETV